jgi:hypothetical protein
VNGGNSQLILGEMMVQAYHLFISYSIKELITYIARLIFKQNCQGTAKKMDFVPWQFAYPYRTWLGMFI